MVASRKCVALAQEKMTSAQVKIHLAKKKVPFSLEKVNQTDADSVDPFQTTLLPLDFAGVVLPFEATDRLDLFKIRYIKAFLHTHIIKPPHEKNNAR